jgi:hypothetical protein
MGSFKSDIQATRSEAVQVQRDHRSTSSIKRNYYCIDGSRSWIIRINYNFESGTTLFIGDVPCWRCY